MIPIGLMSPVIGHRSSVDYEHDYEHEHGHSRFTGDFRPLS